MFTCGNRTLVLVDRADIVYIVLTSPVEGDLAGCQGRDSNVGRDFLNSVADTDLGDIWTTSGRHLMDIWETPRRHPGDI